MFNPIEASQNIKGSFIDYITTSFNFADTEYRKKFREELQKPGVITKGPYLDVSGSYETGASISDLISEGTASSLFRDLEKGEDGKRELPLQRPLYLHQVEALKSADSGNNIVVTTGTGSGKTECFLIPIINALLKEIETGTLTNAVRAIIIYPMNALANDQMKRMRKLLKDYDKIKFGLYNGNTKHDHADAVAEYRRINGSGSMPLKNEILSREEMQEQPPHILITNYSMLEYMMLRPRDDKVFSGAQLRFIVLDEAHIYKGATGMETSLLMRRLQARISKPHSVQYILTSATLGGKDADNDIVAFANRLTGVTFHAENIIRSKEKVPAIKVEMDFPTALFAELAAHKRTVKQILADYSADFAPQANDEEKLFELCLRSKLFSTVRNILKKNGPMTVHELKKAVNQHCKIDTEQELVDFISVCSRAEKNKTNLVKARYHFFVRALEGAYITLNNPKQLFLQRKTRTESEENLQTVFECGICSDCGRLALVGRTIGNKLLPVRQMDQSAEYYLIKDNSDGDLINDDTDDSESISGENDYVICPHCGAISSETTARFEAPCNDDPKDYVKLLKIQKKDNSNNFKCPACGFGHIRRFYLGSDAATAVLGTELFEHLPESEEIALEESAQDTPKSIFQISKPSTTETRKKARQFLCFSDSRSEAAYFASYMQKMYEEFLRRRGIWHVAQKLKNDGETSIPVKAFVKKLQRYFIENKTFWPWDADSNYSPDDDCEKNAWIAVLNEMYNARRSTGLAAMGLLSFEYTRNDRFTDAIVQNFNLSPVDSRALLELLVMDGVYGGAVNAGNEYTLQDPEREYIFFAPKPKCMKRVKQREDAKKSWIMGWAARARNGKYIPNGRVLRLEKALNISEEDANKLLEGYWDNVFCAGQKEEYALNACDFRIRINGDPGLKFYHCRKCGKITPYNCKNQCSSIKCDGELEECSPLESLEHNHYVQLYSSQQMKPLYIEEHTAQLSREQQSKYQEAFVNKKINALSCSTTFEMGVDVGSLETIFMRNVPPTPANYAQRAGRAGRSLKTAAYVLTYAKLSSHDFTFFENPTAMICGAIKAPVFSIENHKIIYRHIFAVALSSFFALNEDVYDGGNATAFLNEGGYERLKDYLNSHPESLKILLQKSIPDRVQKDLGVDSFSWVDHLVGEQGILETAVSDYNDTIQYYQEQRKKAHDAYDDVTAGEYQRKLKKFRCSKEDSCGQRSLIDFLVRNNVLPKYGFPVDTVELLPDISSIGKTNSLQLARDLQMAIAEYAPGSQVIADGKMYTSRYIRKSPVKNTSSGWELGHYCICPNQACGEPNFTKEDILPEGRRCVSCGEMIGKESWKDTLEPRKGFLAEAKVTSVPMHRPEREYKTDDCYIGDPHRNLIDKLTFTCNGQKVDLESTANDSMLVVVDTSYHVCPVCGYASEGTLPKKHNTAFGVPCKNTEGKSEPYLLSHDFKTDVAKITFETPKAQNWETMISVLYALLESMSRTLGIERTDIKGTLHKVLVNNQLMYSVILYDAVAGGAGHVRRIVTKDGKAFSDIIQGALSLTENCGCDTSCYKCLRNYYNQKIHDELDRNKAADFLKDWAT